MKSYTLLPRVGVLIMYRATGTLYELLELHPRAESMECRCAMRRAAYYDEFDDGTPSESKRYSYFFEREYFAYTCWNCLEPLELHAHWKCPFASTRFKLRRTNA